MNLTKLQREILLHRLESDGLPDSFEDDDKCTYDEAVAAAESVTARINGNRWDGLTELEKQVLVNCCEASLWIATMEEVCDPMLIGRHIKSGQELAEKISRLTGLPCTMSVE